MPNNNLVFDSFPGEPMENTASVLSPYHPANNRSHSEINSTYTFRQRQTKLNLTLGWELEANHAPMRVPSGIERISDGSVDGDGTEFVVMPAVTKSPRFVLGLLKDLVHAPRLNTNESCGFHVHVSASNLSSIARLRQWAIATEHLALQVEDLAFKAVPSSRMGNSYCRRITPLSHGTSFPSHKYNNHRRYHWLNIVEMFRPGGIRTIEVRLLGNTHRWKYVLAWSLFSMELARRGWDIANKPFDTAEHVDALGQMLIKIAKEIKPLEKKLEPVPQWVYNGLATFGIEADTFERPLARLSETESDLRGMPRRFYSDNQEIEAMSRDEDDDSCPCGCGDEGRCQEYEHNEGECDSNYCARCHEGSNCDGLPECEHCILRAHEDGEDCTRRTCPRCHPQPRVNRAPVRVTGIDNSNPTEDLLNVRPVTAAESNVIIHSSNVLETRTMPATVPLTFASLREGVERMGNTFPNVAQMQVQMYSDSLDSLMFGNGLHRIPWVEVNERDILDRERMAVETMTPLEYDASLERLEMRRGCPSTCITSHGNNLCTCLTCGEVWGEHHGHICEDGRRGAFPIGGR